MGLSVPQIALMSRLLDEALPLDADGRRRWLEDLPPEYQDLAQALRNALLPERPDAAGDGPLSTLPKLGSSNDGRDHHLQSGARVGPYELIRPLGAGGMAEVWLARRADGAIKRDVALKLTRLRADLEQRFAQERDILAALEHPHIARLYDAGVSPEGLPYLAMEYVHGETLTEWCDAHHLGLDERLQLFLQVLDAVQYAHAHHVIHRDIKPSNILVNESGQVELLDFGVAKLLEQGDPLTLVYGRALTPGYASPEFARGDAVEPASDVYSLGVVLYELLAGRRPYEVQAGDPAVPLDLQIIAAELPPPSTHLAPNAGAARGTTQAKLARKLRGDLDAIVLKAAAKEPAQRYQSAADTAEDVRRYLHGEPVKARSGAALYRSGKFLHRHRTAVWLTALSAIAIAVIGVDRLTMSKRVDVVAPPSFTPPPHSVAVLPFTNLSGDAQQDYFSDGISEELINALSHVDALQVSARTSSFAFKGKDADVGAIARRLNVAAILEGSIRRSGNTVRVTAQLINTANGFHTWSQTYDRDLSDVLMLQTEIATAVAQEMQVKLLGDETAKMEAGGTRNPAAYDAYLRGTQLQVTQQSIAAVRLALAAFDQAIALDPNFAAAHAQRAIQLRGLAIFSSEPAAVLQFYTQARQEAERAVALAPDYAVAHMVLGWHILVNGFLDLRGAAREIERAMALAPGSAAVLDGYAGFQGILGHHDAALVAMRRAVRLDPQNSHYREHLLLNLSWARRFEDVLVAALDVKALYPENDQADFYSATSNLALGHPEVALQICGSPATLLDEGDRHFCLALAEHALGNNAQAVRELGELKALRGDLGAPNYAAVYAQWGDPTAALRWLATAEHVSRPSLLALKVDWMFDPVRSQPQFQALEQRLNLLP